MAVAAAQLKVLISSKQSEFVDERAAIMRAIRPLPLLVANSAEEWSPESMPIELKSVKQAAECAIYVGLFGCVYSHPTVLEYQEARKNPYRELLVYVRRCDQRDTALVEFLKSVEDPQTGHSVRRFQAWPDVAEEFIGHLWSAIARMTDRLLRLANPPVAMGGASALKRKWLAEREALLALGLPTDPEHAQELATMLLRNESVARYRAER